MLPGYSTTGDTVRGTGTKDRVYHDPRSWSKYAVPKREDFVDIPATANDPVILRDTVMGIPEELTMRAGAMFIVLG